MQLQGRKLGVSDVGGGGGRAMGAESITPDAIVDRYKAGAFHLLDGLEGREGLLVGEAAGDVPTGWGGWELVVGEPGREGSGG